MTHDHDLTLLLDRWRARRFEGRFDVGLRHRLAMRR
jgi:hypothetical protein